MEAANDACTVWVNGAYGNEHSQKSLSVSKPIGLLCNTNLYNTRSSADADNRLDAFSGQSRSTNMVPFHM